MQHMLTEGCVDWQGFGQQIAQEANELLGGTDAALIFDESGFAKKGGSSAGVARQWNGRLGKVDNCQVGVFAALYRGDMATLIDTRLYLPEDWCNVRCAARKPRYRRISGSFKVKRSWRWPCLKWRSSVGFNSATSALTAVTARNRLFCGASMNKAAGLSPMCIVTKRFTCMIQNRRYPRGQAVANSPSIENPNAPDSALASGRAHRAPVLGSGSLYARATKACWLPITCAPRLGLWDGEEENARCWHLLVRREVGADSISHFCLSNAPLDTAWQELVRVQAQRFFIEHSFREAKSECGMADYQVRRWDAWHHHMALVMLGTLFLVKQKKAGRQQWPMLSFNDLVTALGHLLPRRQLTAEELADIINKRHYLRQKAKESHARRSQVARE